MTAPIEPAKGEARDAGDDRQEPGSAVQYADSLTVLTHARQIASENAELMRRLA